MTRTEPSLPAGEHTKSESLGHSRHSLPIKSEPQEQPLELKPHRHSQERYTRKMRHEVQTQLNSRLTGSLEKFTLVNDMKDSSVPSLPLADSPLTRSKEYLRSKSEVHAMTPSKKAAGGEKIVKIEVGDFDAAMHTAVREIVRQKDAGFSGLMLFMIKGESSAEELERYRKTIQNIINECGYVPRFRSAHPNIVFFKMLPEATPKKREKSLQAVSRKKAFKVPVGSPEKAVAMIKAQLKSVKGVAEFVPETGKYPGAMREFPQKVIDVCKQCGFGARIADEEMQIVECWPLPMSEKRERARITVKLPSFDAESAEDVIRKQLESNFQGIVVFEAEKKFFSKSQMKNYPRRILDLCKEYGFKARVIDPVTNSVECDMPDDGDPVVYQLPADDRMVVMTVNKSLASDRAAVFKPVAGEFAPSMEKLIIATCTDAGKRAVKNEDNSISWFTPRPDNSNKLVVPLSTFDRAAAESLIHTHLESDFKGILIFKPGHGVYSSALMQDYPERIQEICDEYGYEGLLQANQIVECDKSRKMIEKTVELPCNDDEAMEELVMNELRSGVRETVLFVPQSQTTDEEALKDFPKKVMDICQTFGYEASGSDLPDHIFVQCVMKPVLVQLPATDKAALEYIVRKQIFDLTGCVCKFVPEEDTETISGPAFTKFKDRIHAVCKDCGCKAYDSPSDEIFVLCKTRRKRRSLPRELSPIKALTLLDSTHVTVALPTFDPKTAESLVRAQLDSGFVGTVRFQPRSYKYSETMMKDWPKRLFDIIHEFGFSAYFVNEASQIVECKMTAPKARRPS